MIAERKRIVVYILDADDGLSTDDKLMIVAREYLADAEMASALTIQRTLRGKPYFSNCPQLYVSPSHSGAYFVCAVADYPVGADIQIHSGLRGETPEEMAARLCRIARRYFTPAETVFLQEDTSSRFFALWTARESFVKYTGQGIDGYFEEHCVLPGGIEPLPMPHENGGIAQWRALGASFWQMPIAGEYTLCICAEQDFWAEIRWLRKKTSQ